MGGSQWGDSGGLVNLKPKGKGGKEVLPDCLFQKNFFWMDVPWGKDFRQRIAAAVTKRDHNFPTRLNEVFLRVREYGPWLGIEQS